VIRLFLLQGESFLTDAIKEAEKEAYQQWVASLDLHDRFSTTSLLPRQRLASSFQYGRWWIGVGIPVLIRCAIIVVSIEVEGQALARPIGVGFLVATLVRAVVELWLRLHAMNAMPATENDPDSDPGFFERLWLRSWKIFKPCTVHGFGSGWFTAKKLPGGSKRRCSS
jgi:hypothetical protein